MPPASTVSSAPSTSTLSTSGTGNLTASQSSVTVGTSCVDRTPPAMAVPKPARWLVARLRRATWNLATDSSPETAAGRTSTGAWPVLPAAERRSKPGQVGVGL